MEYSLKQLRGIIIEYPYVINVSYYSEIPRLTKQEYNFHFLRGFLDGIRESR